MLGLIYQDLNMMENYLVLDCSALLTLDPTSPML